MDSARAQHTDQSESPVRSGLDAGHAAVGDGPSPSALPVNHSGAGSTADAGGNLVGVFGNNWMFFIPTSGPFAGVHFPFAIGPTRCEITGPTFVGNTLVLSEGWPTSEPSLLL